MQGVTSFWTDILCLDWDPWSSTDEVFRGSVCEKLRQHIWSDHQVCGLSYFEGFMASHYRTRSHVDQEAHARESKKQSCFERAHPVGQWWHVQAVRLDWSLDNQGPVTAGYWTQFQSQTFIPRLYRKSGQRGYAYVDTDQWYFVRNMTSCWNAPWSYVHLCVIGDYHSTWEGQLTNIYTLRYASILRHCFNLHTQSRRYLHHHFIWCVAGHSPNFRVILSLFISWAYYAKSLLC